MGEEEILENLEKNVKRKTRKSPAVVDSYLAQYIPDHGLLLVCTGEPSSIRMCKRMDEEKEEEKEEETNEESLTQTGKIAASFGAGVIAGTVGSRLFQMAGTR